MTHAFWQTGDVTVPHASDRLLFNVIAPIDLNGDGSLDLVLQDNPTVTTGTPRPLIFLLNDGAGHFVDGTATLFPGTVPATLGVSQFVVAELNGDNRQDLYLPDGGVDAPPFAGWYNTLLLSSGPSSVVDASANLPHVSAFTHNAAAADIDNDGDIDLFDANVNSSGDPFPYLLLNNGSGVFTRGSTSRLPSFVGTSTGGNTFLYTSAGFMDADNDGDKDLLLGSWGGNNGSSQHVPSILLFNDGTGNFTYDTVKSTVWDLFDPSHSYSVPTLATLDINGDGFLDAALSGANWVDPSQHHLFLNDGTGKLVDATASLFLDLNAGTEPVVEGSQTFFVDVNNDGFKDLFAPTQTAKYIYLNDGTGHFKRTPGDLLDGYAIGMVPADLNGDGRTDFVAFTPTGGGDGLDHFPVFFGYDVPASQTGDVSDNSLLGDADGELLFGLGGADVMFGAGGDDTLTGGDGNDYLNGGLGNDALDGGNDNDTLNGFLGNDQLAGLLGTDAIAGGGGLDRAFYGAARSAYALTHNADGSWTVSGPEGADTLNTVERVVFSDQTISLRLAPVFDFSGEGNGDILFQNDATSQVAVWTQSGLTSTSADAIAASAAGGWVVKAASDIDGDANADILLQNSGTGEIAAWLMNGLTVLGADAVHAIAGAAWSMIGTGDFNNDLKYDILLQNNTTSQIAVWLMNGLVLSGGDAIAASASGGWQIKGIGDFNGDGKSDALLQNSTTNQVSIWLMNGLAVQSADLVAGGNAGTDWRVKGTGDFNGDGKSDILLQNSSTNQVAVWFMNGLAVNGGDAINQAVASGALVKGAEDLNGDGSSDILFQNTNGTVSAWLMNGLQVATSGNIGSNPGSAWQVIAPTG